MSLSLKNLVLGPATLLARFRRKLLDKPARLWALAKLRASLIHPVPASVVALGAPEVHGTGDIRLGERLYLYRELHLETQHGGRIHIGDDVVISRGTHIVAFQHIEIGAGSMIGEYASIRDANHRFGGDTESIRHSGHASSPVIIGSNVWIGRGVTILPGVVIHDGAVVGANAVVTRSVAPGTVVAGVPARPIAQRKAA